MVVTVEQGIPMNSRGFFLRERDALNSQFGVRFKFPKGREFMHGNYQTMLITGTQSDINAVMPQVRRILEEAQNQYESFKERQSRRRKMATRPPMATSKPGKMSTSDAPKPNPFAALDGLFEQEIVQNQAELASRIEQDRVREEKKAQKKREKEAILNGTAPKPLPRPVTTMNYAAMAAKEKPVEQPVKPTQRQAQMPAVKLVIVPKKTKVSWADMASEEEELDNSAWTEEPDWSTMDWSEM